MLAGEMVHVAHSGGRHSAGADDGGGGDGLPGNHGDGFASQLFGEREGVVVVLHLVGDVDGEGRGRPDGGLREVAYLVFVNVVDMGLLLRRPYGDSMVFAQRFKA